MASPAVLIGGVALVWPYSLLRHLVALAALPGAVAGIIGGLVDRGYRRARQGSISPRAARTLGRPVRDGRSGD